MNLQELKDLLFEVRMIMPNINDRDEIKSFKLKVLGIYKEFFPNQKTISSQIENLSFEPNFLEGIDPEEQEYDWRQFFNSKVRLVTILEAKVSDLEKIENESKADLSLEIRVLNSSVQDLENKNRQLSQLADTYAIDLKEQSKNLEYANSQLRLSSSDVIRLEKEVTRAKSLSTAIKWAALVAAFVAGAGAASIKVDFDKHTLQEKVDEQKISIDSLKKLSNLRK